MSSLESMAEAGAGLEFGGPQHLLFFATALWNPGHWQHEASRSLISLVLGDRIAWRELCLCISFLGKSNGLRKSSACSGSWESLPFPLP